MLEEKLKRLLYIDAKGLYFNAAMVVLTINKPMQRKGTCMKPLFCISVFFIIFPLSRMFLTHSPEQDQSSRQLKIRLLLKTMTLDSFCSFSCRIPKYQVCSSRNQEYFLFCLFTRKPHTCIFSGNTSFSYL